MAEVDINDVRLFALVWVSLILFTFYCVFAGQRSNPVVFGRLGTAGFFGTAFATFMVAAFLSGHWPEYLPVLHWWMLPLPFLLVTTLLFTLRTGESLFADATITVTVNGKVVRKVPVVKPPEDVPGKSGD